ncbi:MAG: hypothetical protein WA108_03305 [Thiobacillus sp.]
MNFPGWIETKPLEQARRQAVWLSKWLTSAVGEAVTVRPVLALPGWFVERKSRSDVLLISGREAPSILKAKQEALSESMIKRIEHQLEQRCLTLSHQCIGSVSRLLLRTATLKKA